MANGDMRKRSGRKEMPAPERKVTVSFYPQKKVVDLVGEERIKELALKAAMKEYLKMSKK